MTRTLSDMRAYHGASHWDLWDRGSPAASSLETLEAPVIDSHTIGALLPEGASASPALLDRAADVASTFRDLSTRYNRVWQHPNVTVSPEGEVVLEWWRGARKLTIYVAANGTSYLKVWGPNMHDEMEDGLLKSLDTATHLWTWLA
jgi:hypothetical protein